MKFQPGKIIEVFIAKNGERKYIFGIRSGRTGSNY